ncbi:MAG: 8-amino-7-oxononanoate synthase [Planctomycetes bacterium]|nr:8-amino-7-oxononanoate synthase [Planctomycetota bacterium]
MRWLLDELAEGIKRLKEDGLHRSLREPRGIDFSSNDYLGLSRHPGVLGRMREALERGPAGSPASRLLRGSLPGHRVLEEKLARFKGTEAALLFPSGYQANIAVLTALLGPGDLALSDALNHASLIDGLRLARCEKTVCPHLDLEAVERALRSRPRGRRAFVVTESLFSMDGDEAPLRELADLSERHGAALLVDDAHATGLFGPSRRSGLCEERGVEGRCASIVSTAGKALGLWGAFVAGPAPVIEHLVNRARPFIFTTAVPPVLVAGLEAALDALRAEPWRREHAFGLSGRLRQALEARGVPRPPGAGPIVPIVMGRNDVALRVAAELQRGGFDVRAVRPPSVPAGTARLRIAVHADHEEAQVDALAEALAGALLASGASLEPQTACRSKP